MIALLRRRREQSCVVQVGLALVAVLASSAVFHVFNPHRTAATRYLAMAIAPLVALALFGARDAAMRTYPVYWRRAARGILALFIAGSAFATRPPIRSVQPMGYRSLVHVLAQDGQLASRRFLIVSDEVGEGAFVSEAAIADALPAPTIVRGSKLLASDNWNGQNLKLTYTSSEALFQELSARQIDYVVLDLDERSVSLPYFSLARELVGRGQLRPFRSEIWTYATTSRPVEIYQLNSSTAVASDPFQPQPSR
jgi:hypothetical protein